MKISLTLLTAQDMIIKGSLIANDIAIKVAISFEITVISVYYKFEITDWHIKFHYVWPFICNAVLSVLSSFTIISLRKRELVALL